MKVCYVAGPYRGRNNYEIECNVRRAEFVTLAVFAAGHAPICPHAMTRYFQGVLVDDAWLTADFELQARCDLTLVLPDWQDSEGARMEIENAGMLKQTVRYLPPGCTEWHLEDLAEYVGDVLARV